MIVTKEQQERLVDNYIKLNPTNLEIMGFIYGMNAAIELVDKLMKEKKSTT